MKTLGLWAHDPYSSIIMQLAGKEFLKDKADVWKQSMGAELILAGKHGGDGCTFPPLSFHHDSKERLMAFSDAYRQADQFLATIGEVISVKFLRDNDMVGMLLSGSDDISTREVRQEAQQVIRLIDEYVAAKFPPAIK